MIELFIVFYLVSCGLAVIIAVNRQSDKKSPIKLFLQWIFIGSWLSFIVIFVGLIMGGLITLLPILYMIFGNNGLGVMWSTYFKIIEVFGLILWYIFPPFDAAFDIVDDI